MFFQLKFSFSFSFSLRNDAICERPQHVNEKSNSVPASIPRRKVEPRPMDMPAVVSAPIRPVLPRFARYFRTGNAPHSGQMSETDDTRIADTPLSKASDRDSLEIPLRSSGKHEQSVINNGSNTVTADESPDLSLNQHSPVVLLDSLAEDPFGSSQSRVLEDDSGSNLISSLQRLRLGGLSSYLLDLDKRTDFPTSTSATPQVSVGHDQQITTGSDADQVMRAYDTADEEWEEVTDGESSGEEQRGISRLARYM